MGYNSTSVQIEVFPQEGRKWRTARRWQQTKLQNVQKIAIKDIRICTRIKWSRIVRIVKRYVSTLHQVTLGLYTGQVQGHPSVMMTCRWMAARQLNQGGKRYAPHTPLVRTTKASPHLRLSFSEQFRLHHDQVGDGTWWKCMVLSVTWTPSVFEHFIM